MKPIDLQTALPKTVEASRVRQVRDDEADSKQRAFSQQVQEEASRRQKQVPSSRRAQQERIQPGRDRGERQGGRGKRDKPRQAESTQDEARESPDPNRGRRVNLII